MPFTFFVSLSAGDNVLPTSYQSYGGQEYGLIFFFEFCFPAFYIRTIYGIYHIIYGIRIYISKYIYKFYPIIRRRPISLYDTREKAARGIADNSRILSRSHCAYQGEAILTARLNVYHGNNHEAILDNYTLLQSDRNKRDCSILRRNFSVKAKTRSCFFSYEIRGINFKFPDFDLFGPNFRSHDRFFRL